MSSNYTDETNVEKAILSLLVKGTNPSVEAIRAEIALMFGFDEGDKKGSPNEILRIKRSWQQKLKESMAIEVPEHLPDEVLSNFEVLWQKNKELAESAFDEDRKKMESTIEGLSIELESIQESEALLASKVSHLNDVIEEKSHEINALQDIVDIKNSEISDVKAESIKLRESLSVLEEQSSNDRIQLLNNQKNYMDLMEKYGNLNDKYGDLVEQVLSKKNDNDS